MNRVNVRIRVLVVSSLSGDGFATAVGYRQGTVTQSDLTVGAYTANAQSSDEIAEMTTLQTAASDANSVYYSGVSYFPLGIVQVFTITNQTVEHELIVIQATHHSKVHGNYSCEFKAIPSDVAAPHYTDVHAYAKADTQPAKVKDNNDPEGLGRVKVAFYWASGSTTSEWMRMLQPHSGSGKGFYFIPEVGEEVLVGFEGGNAQNPYVMGAQYNGMESSGYNSGDNDQKVIHTRSGTKMVFNDAEGSILIEDPSGNTWQMDGQGNISVDAPNDITMNAGGSISVIAGKDISVNAGMNIAEIAGVNISQNANAMISQKAGTDYILMVANIFEEAKGERKSKAKEVSDESKDKKIMSKNKNEIHTKGDFENNGGESTRMH